MHSFTSGHRRWSRLTVAAIAAVALVAVAAPGAQASFVTSSCGGSNIVGDGSSLQNVAQTGLWDTVIFPGLCPGGPTVTYTGDGSGAGRKAMGAADGNRTGALNLLGSRFAGTDDPPTVGEQANMNNGPTASTADDALIHIIPVASAAITVDINVPADCIGSIPAANLDSTGRVKLPNATLVGVFAGTITTWGGATGVFGTTASAACNADLVRRVVRTDSSGSTFVLKTFLNHIAPGNFDVANNTAWPNSAGNEVVGSCPASNVMPVDTHTLCRPTATGGGALGTLLSTTDGAIGYMDLATARGKGFDFGGTLATDHTSWMELQSPGNAATYVDAVSDPNGWKSAAAPGGAGTKGANCLFTTYNNVPTGTDPTLGDWSHTDGTAPATGYPACTLTWDLAYDDNAKAYGNTPTEEKLARTVKDFLTGVVSVGQAQLGANDYAALSPALQTAAQTGVAAIDWNKTSGGGGTPTTTETTPPPTTTTTTTTTPVTPPPPSNKFTLASSHVSGHKLVLSLQLPGAGKLAVKGTATYKGKSVTVASSTRTVAGGTGSITLSAGASTLAALKKVSSLKVKVTITFTPTGGSAASKSVTLTLKGTPPKKKKH